jgi:hypothetical protein
MEDKSLEERARYVFILSPVMTLGDAGSSSKGDVTLYKEIGGSAPKSCRDIYFMTGHNRFKLGHTFASFLPLRMLWILSVSVNGRCASTTEASS